METNADPILLVLILSYLCPLDGDHFTFDSNANQCGAQVIVLYGICQFE
jgi:hypothetical protein